MRDARGVSCEGLTGTVKFPTHPERWGPSPLPCIVFSAPGVNEGQRPPPHDQFPNPSRKGGARRPNLFTWIQAAAGSEPSMCRGKWPSDPAQGPPEGAAPRTNSKPISSNTAKWKCTIAGSLWGGRSGPTDLHILRHREHTEVNVGSAKFSPPIRLHQGGARRED